MSKTLTAAVLVISGCMLVAGCSYTPARVKSEPLIILDDGHGGHRQGNGDFCPPGQAKKGNC